MELLSSRDEYLIIDGDACLRCSRIDGQLTASSPVALAEQVNPSCLGLVYGVVGRVSFTSGGPSYLILIKERKCVASHPLNKAPIFKIDKVVAIPLTTQFSNLISEEFSSTSIQELQLPPCPKHQHDGKSSIITKEKPIIAGMALFQKGQKKMAKATADSLKFVTNKITKSVGNTSATDDAKSRSRIERRLLAELLRMFNESDSFYYCPTVDLTNGVQQLCADTDAAEKAVTFSHTLQRFDKFDSRFFWNSYMLRDLIEQSRSDFVATQRWLVPVIQGFVGVEKCILNSTYSKMTDVGRSPEATTFQLTLISRRSVHRAGTRYIKRGIDDDGYCANYVETEQILCVAGHAVAFTQIRGSVPIYWSQVGYKYRPPPKLDRTKTESLVACRKHFDDELKFYDALAVVNLVEQNGREKVLSDAYVDHMLELDDSKLTYVAFDFHEHCRGLKFENVTLLTGAVDEFLTKHRFCWVDNGLLNCTQTGVCRVNCVDCLDRTNVVQAALGRNMLEWQLKKFGLLPPEEAMPAHCLQAFQLLWAANGDAISHQYAGTVALKGDFTRTGQRNFAGVVKDGYNSANRYYLCHMKDARRQAAIDAILGKRLADSPQDLERLLSEPPGDTDEQMCNETWLKEKDEQLRLLVRDCEKLVVPDGEVLLGSWALIDADPGTGNESEDDMDICVMLTRSAYFVADYDEELDKFVSFERVALTDIVRMEAGPMTVASVLGVPKLKATCFRIYYKLDAQQQQQQQRNNVAGTPNSEEYFHVWRSGSTRLFNNLAIAIKNSDEADEYVKAIAEQFRVALELIERPMVVSHPMKLERKKSKIPPMKAASRRSANGFGAPIFLTSLGGKMNVLGTKFTSAFNKPNGSGTKFFRLPSLRRDGAAKTDGMSIRTKTVDAKGLTPNILLYAPKVEEKMNFFIHKEAGILFIGSARPPAKTIEENNGRKGENFLSKKYRRKSAVANVNYEVLVRKVTPAITTTEFFDQTEIGREGPVENAETGNIKHASSSKNLADASGTNSIPVLSMKTSRSECSFKPMQQNLGNHWSTPEKPLALSNSDLDKAVNKGPMLKLPLLFKRKGDDGILSPTQKFAQFQERISKSQMKFIFI